MNITIKKSRDADKRKTIWLPMEEDTGDFIGVFRENVIGVIGGYSTKEIPTEYDEKIEILQK